MNCSRAFYPSGSLDVDIRFSVPSRKRAASLVVQQELSPCMSKKSTIPAQAKRHYIFASQAPVFFYILALAKRHYFFAPQAPFFSPPLSRPSGIAFLRRNSGLRFCACLLGKLEGDLGKFRVALE